MGPCGQEPRRHDVSATERRELVSELRWIADTLHLCAGRLQTLVDRLAAHPAAAADLKRAPQARVSFGGGESVISDPDARRHDDVVDPAHPREAATAPALVPALGERLGRLDAERVARGRDTRVRRHELLTVTELVHLGYTREDIGQRLRARWGDRTSSILAEAFDERDDSVTGPRPG